MIFSVRKKKQMFLVFTLHHSDKGMMLEKPALVSFLSSHLILVESCDNIKKLSFVQATTIVFQKGLVFLRNYSLNSFIT